MYKNCSECQEQFLYTTCSPHVLQKRRASDKDLLVFKDCNAKQGRTDNKQGNPYLPLISPALNYNVWCRRFQLESYYCFIGEKNSIDLSWQLDAILCRQNCITEISLHLMESKIVVLPTSEE